MDGLNSYEIPSIDVETFMALKRVSSNKSLLDYEAFKEIKGKTKEIKNDLKEIITNPGKPSERRDDYEIIFSKLARLFSSY